MINLIECLDQVGMLFLFDLSRQECTTYTSQEGFDVPDSPKGHGEEKRVFADNKHRWRQVTRCVGHEIALLSENTGEITNLFAPQESAEKLNTCSHLTECAEDKSRTSLSTRIGPNNEHSTPRAQTRLPIAQSTRTDTCSWQSLPSGDGAI